MAKANPDRVVDTVVEGLTPGALEAARKTVAVGAVRLEPAELKQRWPSLGDAERKRIMESLATPGDPRGVRAWYRLTGGKK